MGNFTEYYIPVCTSVTGGRVICYAYLVEETTQKKQPSYLDANDFHMCKARKRVWLRFLSSGHFGLLSQ